jgi:hypothetical protein
LRAGVGGALRQFLELIGRPGAPEIDRQVYRDLGRFECREGRALESLLGAYRLGARVAWRRAAQAARAAGHDAEALALLAESIFAYIDELSSASAEGYAEEQSASVHETERRRAALLALLVQHPAAAPAAVEQAARAAAWPLPERAAVLVWASDGTATPPVLPPGSLRGRDDDLGLAVLPDPDAPGRLRQLAGVLAGTTAALGPPVGWRDAGLSGRRARQVLGLARAGVLAEGRLLAAGDHLAAVVVHAEPGLAAELAERRLAPLAGLPGRTGERLAATLRAWLDHQGSVPAVARELAIHPQTVRYRMRRLRELFGDALDDPRARFELALALRA